MIAVAGGILLALATLAGLALVAGNLRAVGVALCTAFFVGLLAFMVAG